MRPLAPLLFGVSFSTGQSRSFRSASSNILQKSHNLQTFAKFQKFQLDNLVDLENCCKRIFTCKNRCRYSRKRATFCRNFAKNWQLPQVHPRKRGSGNKLALPTPTVQRTVAVPFAAGASGPAAADGAQGAVPIVTESSVAFTELRTSGRASNVFTAASTQSAKSQLQTARSRLHREDI